MTAPPEKITEREALEALWGEGEPRDDCPVAVLAERTGQPEKVALRKIERLVDKGYADYGTSPWYAWRTPEGEDRLKELAE